MKKLLTLCFYFLTVRVSRNGIYYFLKCSSMSMFTLHFLEQARKTILDLNPSDSHKIDTVPVPSCRKKQNYSIPNGLEKKTTFNNIFSNMFSDLPCADIFRVSLREHVRQFSNQLRSGLQFKDNCTRRELIYTNLLNLVPCTFNRTKGVIETWFQTTGHRVRVKHGIMEMRRNFSTYE